LNVNSLRRRTGGHHSAGRAATAKKPKTRYRAVLAHVCAKALPVYLIAVEKKEPHRCAVLHARVPRCHRPEFVRAEGPARSYQKEAGPVHPS